MFYHVGAMAHASPDVTAALATLQARWGAAAPRVVGEVVGALATVPLPAEMAALPEVAPRPTRPRIVHTGFAALDAILGLGGVPRQAGLALHGDDSSGKTTLAMRLVAEAQAAGAIVAWLDLSRSLDPVEAVARGVRLEWLVVLTPDNARRGPGDGRLARPGSGGRLLVVDLAVDSGARSACRPAAPGHPGASPGAAGAARRRPRRGRPAPRLAAIARRAGVLLVVLEPPGLPRRA